MGVISIDQLRDFVAHNPVPEPETKAHVREGEGPFTLAILKDRLRAWTQHNEKFKYQSCRTSKGDGFMIVCPGGFGWPDGEQHSDGGDEPNGSAVVWVENGWARFRCGHSHCDYGAEHGKKTWRDLQNYYDPDRKYHRIEREDDLTGIDFDEVDLGVDAPVVEPPVAESNPEKNEHRQGEAAGSEPLSDGTSLEMPETAMYGRMGVWARQMQMPIGLAYPALLACYSIEPDMDEFDGTRINVYVALLAVVGGGKNVAIKRARQLLELLEEHWKPCTTASDRGVMNLIGDKPARKKGQDRIAGPKKMLLITNEMSDVIKKMGVQNSNLGSTLCDLWDENRKEVADRNGTQSCDCRLSWLGGIPVNPDRPEEFSDLFGRETARGLVSRMLYGYSGVKFNYRRWSPPQHAPFLTDDEAFEHLAPAVIPTVPDAMYRMVESLEFEGDDSGRFKYNLWKVALLTASANGDSEVTTECMNAAIEFMKWQVRLKEVFTVGHALENSIDAKFTEAAMAAFKQVGAEDEYVSWKRIAHDRKWNQKYGARTVKQGIDNMLKTGVLLPITEENEDGEQKEDTNKVKLRRW